MKMFETEPLLKDLSRDTEILDLGCGTGRLGILIKELGFNNIDGVDAS